MEKTKRFIKTFLIIIGFLIFNIFIDAIVGLFVPGFISNIKTGDILNSKDFAAYGILAGQILKMIILTFFIKKRNKAFVAKLNRRNVI